MTAKKTTMTEALAIALAHHRAGRLDLAEEIYRRMLAVEPEHPEGLHLMGMIAHQRGDQERALEYVRRAIRADDRQPAFYNTLGAAYRVLGKTSEAIACYENALRVRPHHATSAYNLGGALYDLGRIDEAIDWYNRAIGLEPDFAEAYNSLGIAYDARGMLDETIDCYRRALELKPDFERAQGNYLFALRHHPGVGPAALSAAHAEFSRRLCDPLRADRRAHDNSREPERPLRLGFVSPRFDIGPVGSFTIRALENVDREQFPIFCYSAGRCDDRMTARFRAVSANWRDSWHASDEELAARIREDRVDVLFDLAGYSAFNRLPVFARKPAPIQITWVDSVGTTGLDAIDYVLADRREIPVGDETHYVEKVLCLPDTYICFDPPIDAPPVGPLPALRNGYLTFGSFNRAVKIQQPDVEVWSRVLTQIPGSRLMLRCASFGDSVTRERYEAQFARNGVPSDRLTFHGSSPHAEFMAAYNEVDVALDPLYNGGLTTCEALWMGVPVLTCPGDTFPRRHSLSHLSAVGFTETIARDYSEYVRIAVSLAQDLPRLAEIRGGLRERVANSPLCDATRFATNLMGVLRNVWRDWCNAHGCY